MALVRAPARGKRWSGHDLSRRLLIYGASAVVTTALASGPGGCAATTGGSPLIAANAAETELHVYRDGRCRSVSRRGDYPDVPPPTWRQYLLDYEAETDDTDAEIERLRNEHELTVEELEEPVPEWWWEEQWQTVVGPTASAYWRLLSIGLGSDHGSKEDEKWLEGLVLEAENGDPTYSVTVADPAVLSRLQERLTELGTGLKLVKGR